ncbi:MAG: hypothetical protein BWY72_00558 [Bacteroidetes bacterium ADurb.Bin416]|nr:MAG: hypothetical protein BWY72_00558 [Bacteroidetes bacterium ADurb.Bin416]
MLTIFSFFGKKLSKNNKKALFYKKHVYLCGINQPTMGKPRITLRLTTLAVLAVAAYVFMILLSMGDLWEGFRLGMEDGQDKAHETHFVYLKAKEGITYYPDSLVNLVSGNTLPISYDQGVLRAPLTETDQQGFTWIKLLEKILAFVVLLIMVYIPIRFFRLMRALSRESIFDRRNIKHMRCIGVALLIFYVSGQAMSLIDYLTLKQQFQFAAYQLEWDQTDPLVLLLGFVVLLFADVLGRGSSIKEEQDLTI